MNTRGLGNFVQSRLNSWRATHLSVRPHRGLPVPVAPLVTVLPSVLVPVVIAQAPSSLNVPASDQLFDNLLFEQIVQPLQGEIGRSEPLGIALNSIPKFVVSSDAVDPIQFVVGQFNGIPNFLNPLEEEESDEEE